jgi:hypothetical protein
MATSKREEKKAAQIDVMTQLMMLQEKLAQQEIRLDKSILKEEKLSLALDEQKQVTGELKRDIKDKDAALKDAEDRLRAYE